MAIFTMSGRALRGTNDKFLNKIFIKQGSLVVQWIDYNTNNNNKKIRCSTNNLFCLILQQNIKLHVFYKIEIIKLLYYA